VKQSTQAAIVARFDDLAEREATTLGPAVRWESPEFYTSPDQFERERDALFRRGVVFVCASADLREPGDYVTTESGGVPIVVVRTRDGDVAAYLNACRHRAFPVATGCGNASRRFVCGFHNWAYSIDDGGLLAQPRSCGGFDGVDAGQLGLARLQVAEAYGVVAVRPVGDEPIDIDAELRGIGPEIGELGIEGYHVHSRVESVWACNWKLILDTFLESYHVFALHRATLGGDQPGHRMWFEPFGPHLRVPVPGPTLYEQEETAPDDRQLIGRSTVQHFLFPNAMLNHVFDYVLLWRFVPTAADRTTAILTRYWPEPIDDELRARLDRRFAWQAQLTRDEDYPAAERIHHALASGQGERTLIGRNEAAITAFHESVEQALHRSGAG